MVRGMQSVRDVVLVWAAKNPTWSGVTATPFPPSWSHSARGALPARSGSGPSLASAGRSW